MLTEKNIEAMIEQKLFDIGGYQTELITFNFSKNDLQEIKKNIDEIAHTVIELRFLCRFTKKPLQSFSPKNYKKRGE